MPTMWSHTLIPTSRQVPAEAEVPSHRLLLRGGFIHKLGSGIYDYLPLGLRSLHKVKTIIRQEMEAAGAVEVLLPALQPIELWQQTGRSADYGDNLFVVKDRHGRPHALGPTHEEVITQLVGAHISSYKQLPITLFQIQTKFRDEFRPRFGALRSREFQMKDAYSFHLELDGPGGLERTYQSQFDAYCRIFRRCGVPYEVVEAESGPIGGSASHEFMVPSPVGEDMILKSDQGNYAANVQRCEIGTRDVHLDEAPTGQLEVVHTPSCPGIEQVVAFFKKQLKTKLKPQHMLKTLVYLATRPGDASESEEGSQPCYVIAVVRGDHSVNESKLASHLRRCLERPVQIDIAPEPLALRDGFAIGFVGPHAFLGHQNVFMAVDIDAAQGGFWVTGANEVDRHVKHYCWQRDLLDKLNDSDRDRLVVSDIRNAVDGDPSPKNDGGILHATKGIEIGHVFKLGNKYSRALDVTVLDKHNQRAPVLMGCYGIGVNRILAAAIEREGGYDDHGIIWPVSIAPYQVIITPIQYDAAMGQTADRLADQLESRGLDVLVDDRDERPGVKFKDADLVGIPLRITVGERALAQGCVEVKLRCAAKAQTVPIEEVVAHAAEAIQTASVATIP